MRNVVVITGLLIYTLLMTGCVQTHSPAMEKIPVFLPTTKEILVMATSQEITPRYHPGDIVDGTQNIERTPHLIILDYNKTSGEYDYDIIFRNANKSWGYRIYPEHRYMPIAEFERNASFLLTHINLTDLETWFPSKEIFERTP